MVPTVVRGRIVEGTSRRSPTESQEATAYSLKAPLSVVLVADRGLLREGLASMLRTREGFTVLAASADVAEALRKVRQSRPAVVLMDIGRADHDSLRLTKTVCTEVPEVKVIVMGLQPGQEGIADFVRAGVCGFIMKDASFEDLLQTIRSVIAGIEVLPAALTSALFTQLARNDPVADQLQVLADAHVTNREQQVIDLLGEGLCNKEIATRLHIAVHTVKCHVHSLLTKLALDSRLAVAAFTHTHRWPHSTAMGVRKDRVAWRDDTDPGRQNLLAHAGARRRKESIVYSGGTSARRAVRCQNP